MKIKVTGRREFELPELLESATYSEAGGTRFNLDTRDKGPVRVELTFTGLEARATAAKLIDGSMFKGHEPDPVKCFEQRPIRDANDQKILNMTVGEFLAWVKAGEPVPLQAEARIMCATCHTKKGRLHKCCGESGCECVCNP